HANSEDARGSGRPQRLDEHHEWTAERAERLADRLSLVPALRAMLVHAARVHDEGKRSQRWQDAFSAPADGVYAKTKGPLKLNLLDGYRHEFASMLALEDTWHSTSLGEQQRDLALHLVAAHHGFARPVIRISG